VDVDVGQIQRIIIKFLVTKGIDSAEIYRRLSAVFKNDTLSRSRLNGAPTFVAVVSLSMMMFKLQHL